MTGWVLAAVLGAAMLHASWNVIVKGRGGGPFVASVGLTACWGMIGVPLLFVVAPLPDAAWPFLAGSVAVHLVYFSLLAWAYERGDLSYIYPIARGVPPILVAAASGFVLGEALPALGVVGVLTIAAGVLALGPAGTVPGRSLLVHALGIATCTAVYTLLDGRGMRTGASATSYTVYLLALQGVGFSVGAVALRGRPLMKAVWAHRWTALVTGTMAALGYGIALWAFSLAPVALVAALRETAVLFAALLGWRVLREPMGPRRLVAAGIVTIGAVLVRMAV